MRIKCKYFKFFHCVKCDLFISSENVCSNKKFDMKGKQFSFYIFAILLQFNCNSENGPFFKSFHSIIEVFHLLDDFLFACQGFFPAVKLSTHP